MAAGRLAREIVDSEHRPSPAGMERDKRAKVDRLSHIRFTQKRVCERGRERDESWEPKRRE